MTPTQELAEQIRQILFAELRAESVEIEDDSWKHAGHAGGHKGHFKVTVVSDLFEGKSLLERHRMVNDKIFPRLEKQVHSLVIKAHTLKEKHPD